MFSFKKSTVMKSNYFFAKTRSIQQAILLTITLFPLTLIGQRQETIPATLRPDSSLVNSRQNEVIDLAALYSIDLQKSWHHETLTACKSFDRYTFVYYYGDNKPNVRSMFLAIIPSDKSPVRLIPWDGGVNGEARTTAAQKATITTFNALWSKEISNSSDPHKFPGPSWNDLAECYANMSGERPIKVSQTLVSSEPSSIDLAHPIGNVLVAVASATGLRRTLAIQFDSGGLVSSVVINTLPTDK
jgi:hypothetical protein